MRTCSKRSSSFSRGSTLLLCGEFPELAMYGLRYCIFLAGYFGCQVSSTRQMMLTNKHLRVGAVPIPPYIIFNQDKNGQTNFNGLLGDLIDYIKTARNCTFTVVTPSDGQFAGNCYGNNTCTGTLGLVNRSEVDFAIGTYTVCIISMLKKALLHFDLNFRTIFPNS